MLDINKQIKNSITITPFNILDALKNIKCGKSSGIDGISAEHFVFAHSRIQILKSGAISCVLRAIFNHLHGKSSPKIINKHDFLH